MADGFEPHGMFLAADPGLVHDGSAGGRGGVYPGWWDGGWVEEGYTGTHPATLQGPILTIFLR